MIGDAWLGLLGGLALAAVAAAAARLAFRGGELRRQKEFRFVCPQQAGTVNCRILQNIRTGQWAGVEACSAFPEPPGTLLCGEDCRRLVNLGFLVPELHPVNGPTRAAT